MRRLRVWASRAGVAACAAALTACGYFGGETERTEFTEVSGTLVDGVEVECRDVERELCEQAVSAIVHGLPAGDTTEHIELAPLDRELTITPEPEWAASAQVRMADGFVYDLVLVQEVQPGPIEVNFAPD